jgi:dTDP-4-dehydrorhamnose 3,5-epimerase-like enzyme
MEMKVEKVSSYSHYTDDRGSFSGLIRTGNWREVNFIFSKAGSVRGNHYHKKLNEFVFLLTGAAQVEFVNVIDKKQKMIFDLKAGEGVYIRPYIYHTFVFIQNTEQVCMLDLPFDNEHPDLYVLL